MAAADDAKRRGLGRGLSALFGEEGEMPEPVEAGGDGVSSSSVSKRSSSSRDATTSVTYRKPSRSSPRSTKADCIPGSTFETRPL